MRAGEEKRLASRRSRTERRRASAGDIFSGGAETGRGRGGPVGPSREEGTLQEGRAESGVGCQHGAGSAGRIPAGVGTPQAPAGQDEGGGHRTLDRWVASYHHISPTATHLEAGTGDAPAGHSQARAGASRAGERRRGAVQRRGREEVAAWHCSPGAERGGPTVYALPAQPRALARQTVPGESRAQARPG